jgi:hypothetical protein
MVTWSAVLRGKILLFHSFIKLIWRHRIDDYAQDLDTWTHAPRGPIFLESSSASPTGPAEGSVSGPSLSRPLSTNSTSTNSNSSNLGASRTARSVARASPYPSEASRRSRTTPHLSIPAGLSDPVLPEPFSTQGLIDHCLQFLVALRAGSAPWVSQRLNSAYDFAGVGLEALINETLQQEDGPSDFAAAFPSVDSANPARIINPGTSTRPTGVKPSRAILSFYIASLLPIDEYEKARLFPIRSAKMRLQLCVWWIEGLRRHWWFERGCVIL